jgi:hypothetical protein
MSSTGFRIKLYGHSSDNPDFFLVELAAVLEIDPESARALLESSPVVIKERLSLEEAEHLRDLLTIIKALFIVEQTDEEIESAAEDTRDLSNQLDELKNDKLEKEERDTLRSYAWIGAAALLAATMVIWLTGEFFSSYFLSSSENSSKKPTTKKEEVTGNPAPSKTPSFSANLSEIYRQMESADQRIKDLEFQVNLAEQELQRLYSGYRVNPNTLVEKRIEVADSKQKLRLEKNAFKILKTQADAIEHSLKRSAN